MGQIMGLILSLTVSKNTNLYSDLLNSVRLIKDSRSSISQEARLRNMNGRSYYQWISNLAMEVWTAVNYTKGHYDEVTLASLLNNEADYYASKSQKIMNSVHPAPYPTFYMDEYTFYRPIYRWIESHIHTFMDYFLTKATSDGLAIGHGYRMATWLYDKRTPPTYPYLRATSAYTALVQLYARSGQLPMAEGMVQKGQSVDNGCRMGCKAVEGMHHIFVACPEYTKLRKEARDDLVKKTWVRLQTLEVEETWMTGLLKKAKSLFIDCSFPWPLHYTLGHVLPLDSHIPLDIFKSRIQHEHLIHNIKGDWHMSSIRLALCIYGQFQKRMAKRRDALEKKRDWWRKVLYIYAPIRVRRGVLLA